MPIYETVFIARQELSDAQVKTITDEAQGFIKDNDGKILKVENWGLRTLAYIIKKNRKGHYVLIESDTPADAMLEMERNLRLNEDVLRFMTVKLDEPTSEPSPMMRKDDRDTGEDTKSKPYNKKEAA